MRPFGAMNLLRQQVTALGFGHLKARSARG
jgi:hypothetical protein